MTLVHSEILSMSQRSFVTVSELLTFCGVAHGCCLMLRGGTLDALSRHGLER